VSVPAFSEITLCTTGYIAVELANMLHGLGSEVHLFVRHDKALRNFDSMLNSHLDAAMKANGMLKRRHHIV
jgi:glutathione reductase (NADPH)